MLGIMIFFSTVNHLSPSDLTCGPLKSSCPNKHTVIMAGDDLNRLHSSTNQQLCLLFSSFFSFNCHMPPFFPSSCCCCESLLIPDREQRDGVPLAAGYMCWPPLTPQACR